MKNFIKKLLRENLDEVNNHFDILENLLDEDYPSSFDFETFKSLKSFNKRIKYSVIFSYITIPSP